MSTFNGFDMLLICLCIICYWLGYMRAKRVAQKIRDAEINRYYQDYANEMKIYRERGDW
tara:strand:+ start:2558 stop:2734 length:177 start_codon:yes stop_codon:yes gene_type:complete